MASGRPALWCVMSGPGRSGRAVDVVSVSVACRSAGALGGALGKGEENELGCVACVCMGGGVAPAPADPQDHAGAPGRAPSGRQRASPRGGIGHGGLPPQPHCQGDQRDSHGPGALLRRNPHGASVAVAAVGQCSGGRRDVLQEAGRIGARAGVFCCCCCFAQLIQEKGKAHWIKTLETEFGGMNEVRAAGGSKWFAPPSRGRGGQQAAEFSSAQAGWRRGWGADRGASCGGSKQHPHRRPGPRSARSLPAGHQG